MNLPEKTLDEQWMCEGYIHLQVWMNSSYHQGTMEMKPRSKGLLLVSIAYEGRVHGYSLPLLGV